VSPTSQLPTAPKAPGWLIAASLLSVYIIWGTTYFAIKVGIEGAAPFFLVGTRFLVAGALLAGGFGVLRGTHAVWSGLGALYIGVPSCMLVALREYARALTAAEETARRKTAADLHDGIGQVLAGQSMTLAAMRMHASHSPLSVLLDEATEASREAQEGLRVMIQDLTPPGLDRASLDETLRWLADYFKTRYGFSVEWRVNGSADFSRDRLRLIYRCVRELLMNARKHSQRHSAEVEVDVSPIMVEITVVDEGIGFDARSAEPPSGDRFGLAQIRERVRAAGGTIDVDAVVGEGCRVIVRLPSPTPMPR